VDLRAYRAGASKRDRKFTELGADFAAAVHGVPKEDLLSEEVRQQRRALALAWSVVVVLLVLGGVALFQRQVAIDAEQVAVEQRLVAEQQRDRANAAERAATEQRDVAQQQRDRAEHILTAATNTGNALVSDLAVKFREVKGIPLTVVGGILDRGKGCSTTSSHSTRQRHRFNSSAQEPGPNSASRSLSRIIQRAASLSLRHMRSPVSSSAKTPIWRASTSQKDELQKCWHSCANVPIPSLPTTFTAKRSNTTRSVIYREHPNELTCLLQEFMTFGRLGNILFDNKKFNDAMGLYQQSLELAQSYVRQLPTGPDVGFCLGGRYNHLGRVFVAIKDMANAMRQFRLAQEAMEPWARLSGVIDISARAVEYIQQYRQCAGGNRQLEPR
jgi:tetratricopeptide (TPR) repeat protein